MLIPKLKNRSNKIFIKIIKILIFYFKILKPLLMSIENDYCFSLNFFKKWFIKDYIMLKLKFT